MCGIVGFTGNHQAAPILLDGLSKLEYRGYDSAGLAVRDGEHLLFVFRRHIIAMRKGFYLLLGSMTLGSLPFLNTLCKYLPIVSARSTLPSPN